MIVALLTNDFDSFFEPLTDGVRAHFWNADKTRECFDRLQKGGVYRVVVTKVIPLGVVAANSTASQITVECRLHMRDGAMLAQKSVETCDLYFMDLKGTTRDCCGLQLFGPWNKTCEPAELSVLFDDDESAADLARARQELAAATMDTPCAQAFRKLFAKWVSPSPPPAAATSPKIVARTPELTARLTPGLVAILTALASCDPLTFLSFFSKLMRGLHRHGEGAAEAGDTLCTLAHLSPLFASIAPVSAIVVTGAAKHEKFTHLMKYSLHVYSHGKGQARCVDAMCVCAAIRASV